MVDKVKDFFGDVTTGAKESFAQITGSAVGKEAEEAEGEAKKFVSKKRKKRKSKQGISKFAQITLFHQCSITLIFILSATLEHSI